MRGGGDRGVADPMAMRRAVAGYVEGIHRAYAGQAATFPPAVRGRMPLLAAGRFTVVAAAARNLHVLATTESLGPLRGEEVELPGALDGLDWTVRFYDPVVLPALGVIDEGDGPRAGEVRGCLGVSTVLYHLVTQPGSGLSCGRRQHASFRFADEAAPSNLSQACPVARGDRWVDASLRCNLLDS